DHKDMTSATKRHRPSHGTLIPPRKSVPRGDCPMSTLKTEQTAVPAFVPARDGLSLEAKGRIASIVVEDALNQFERPVVMWTAGKDSTLTLAFVRSTCDELGLPYPPILFIDHGTHFDETWKLFDQVVAEWKLQSIVARNEGILSARPAPCAPRPPASPTRGTRSTTGAAAPTTGSSTPARGARPPHGNRTSTTPRSGRAARRTRSRSWNDSESSGTCDRESPTSRGRDTPQFRGPTRRDVRGGLRAPSDGEPGNLAGRPRPRVRHEDAHATGRVEGPVREGERRDAHGHGTRRRPVRARPGVPRCIGLRRAPVRPEAPHPGSDLPCGVGPIRPARGAPAHRRVRRPVHAVDRRERPLPILGYPRGRVRVGPARGPRRGVGGPRRDVLRAAGDAPRRPEHLDLRQRRPRSRSGVRRLEPGHTD